MEDERTKELADWTNAGKPGMVGDELPKTILDEAEAIIYGDREQTYGHPAINLERIAILWNAYDEARLIGFPNADKVSRVTHRPEDVAVKMVLLKLAREIHQHKRDNLVDAAGYIALVDRIHHG